MEHGGGRSAIAYIFGDPIPLSLMRKNGPPLTSNIAARYQSREGPPREEGDFFLTIKRTTYH
jgi:hypothetical protein